ncbi:hypothetical protein [Methanosphaerula palustris]|uniref:Uncharacterized protein n=1 Tax=Methanosphaerula palustris (strain ATCC BAA-1556 / DSM 19958 / E1-9c) TaxID=521011 RepID=B8GHX3_METPE|nr:hypothetical protein [Methanosphaerula palustris]ACL16713.1 conserved hypothetical protein [Methanosphaerula palustris E1-9c]
MPPGSDIRQGLEVLLAPGQVFEVRSWTGDRIASGYFDDLDVAAKAIEALDAANPDGIYLTPNPVLPDLLARRANRIKGPLAKKDSSTSDGDILSRRWFLIDIDPARPSGVSSSDKEHQAALDRAAGIAAALGEMGWPSPVAGDSGNGAHLLYRVDLPNDDKVTALIKAALVALDGLFSDEKASVDTAVFNASRIWKVYGTVARKGDSTGARPHRRSRLLSVPDSITIVTREQLAALAITDPGVVNAAAPAPSNRGTGRKLGETLNLAGWFHDHGLGFSDRRPYQGGDLYRLDACPFSSAHTDGAFAIQFGSGAVYASCHHASCGGGSQRWPELREMYERPKQTPAALQNRDEKEAAWRKEKAIAKEEAAGRDGAAPTPVEADAADEAVLAEARQILETGDPLAYMVDAFNLDHVGDQVLGQCLALSLASRLIQNSQGLHVMVTGESGKGKSHGYRAMLRQVPDAYKIKGSFSDKSLFYMDDLRPQSVILVDDKDLSDGIQETLKEATSDFRKPIVHRTLTTERKYIEYTIPARCLWWIAKMEGTGDEQVQNRVLMVWVDESAEQDRAVLVRKLAQESRDESGPAGEPRQVTVCRAMWEILQGLGLVEVNLSRFAHRICFSSARNRRNPDMLADLIRSAALLRFFQRDRRTLDDQTIRLYATPEDFKTAADIFTALNGEAGSQDAKLTKRESQILDIIDRAGLTEFTLQTIVKLTQIPYQPIRRTFAGYFSHGAKYSGLLEKCPALSTHDQTTSSAGQDGGSSVGRKETAFTFNREIYSSWSKGSLVWLRPDDHDGGDAADPEPNSFHQLQHLFSISSAVDEKNSPTDAPADCGKEEGSSIKKNKKELFSSNEITKEVSLDQRAGPVPPLRYSAFAENNYGKKSYGAESTKHEHTGGGSFSSTAEKKGNATEVDEKNSIRPPVLTLAQVRASDYSQIAKGAIVETCPLCSGRLVHYQEKFTAMKNRGGDHPRRLCRSCYTQAKEREQAAVQVLPGAIPFDEVRPITAGLLGRCSVCGLQAATYDHAGSGTAICSRCYEKLVREQVDVR